MSPSTSDSKTDSRARWALVILLLLGAAGLALPFFLPPPAKLELEVVDGVFGTALADRTLTVSLGAEAPPVGTTIHEEEGAYRAWVGRVPAGDQTLTASVPGFEEQTLDLSLPALEVTRAPLGLIPTFGRLLVEVRNARERAETVAAQLTVGGKPVGRGSDVTVSELAPGKHRVRAEANGYCAAEGDGVVERGKTMNLLLPISPILGPEEAARFVLDWGENPRDLDAHLFFMSPPAAVTNSQVFFASKQGTVRGGDPFALLDVDHQNSEGYETTTLFNRLDGRFLYGVHLFVGDGTLGNSSARVEILTSGCVRQEVTVPVDCAERFWYVGDVRILGGRAVVEVKNRCGLPPELSLRSRDKG